MRINPLLRFWRVNFRDYLWFVFIIRGDVFSPKLSVGRYVFNPILGHLKGLVRDKARAHTVNQGDY